MTKPPFICPRDGDACTWLFDAELNGQQHEVWQCTNPQCEKIWSPRKIRNGKKEVAAK